MRLFRRRRREAVDEWRAGAASTREPAWSADDFRHAPDAEPEDVVMPPARRPQPRGPITGLASGGGSGPIDYGAGL